MGSGALGIKVINPGGAAAFKENVRTFGLDDLVPSYGVTSRAIIRAAQHAREALGLPHPVHLHCNNLGVPGNVETALATIAASEGMPLHLAHLQFYAYGTEGKRSFSSAAPRLAEAMAANPAITADVGQVMFGQTTTVSCDVLRQFGARGQASPPQMGDPGRRRQWRRRGALQLPAAQLLQRGAVGSGLELFLLSADPWAAVLHHRPPERRAVHRLPRLGSRC